MLGVEELISWCGFQRDIFSLTSGCAAQVCPSRQEPLGRVIFEAWDAGVVPIAWRGSGGAAEVISSSGGGILYERQEGSCLAEAMLATMKIPREERNQIVNKGRCWLKKTAIQ